MYLFKKSLTGTLSDAEVTETQMLCLMSFGHSTKNNHEQHKTKYTFVNLRQLLGLHLRILLV